MIHLLYSQHGGRSGHKLKDIMSIFIIGMLIKAKVVYDDSFTNQHLLLFEDICVKKKKKYYSTIIIDNTKCSNGITFKKFKEIKKLILNKSKGLKDNQHLLVIFKQRCRIHPYQLDNWFHKNKIDKNLFKSKLIPLLHKIYYVHTVPKHTTIKKSSIIPTNNVAIHIRRGDLAEKLIREGFDANYYTQIINKLNQHLNLHINIYSEIDNSEDILVLKKLKNVNLFLGDVSNINEHFYALCTSKILILSRSSFSTWAAYLSKGLVVFQTNIIKHLYHKVDPNNFYSYGLSELSDDDMEQIKIKHLYHKVDPNNFYSYGLSELSDDDMEQIKIKINL